MTTVASGFCTSAPVPCASSTSGSDFRVTVRPCVDLGLIEFYKDTFAIHFDGGQPVYGGIDLELLKPVAVCVAIGGQQSGEAGQSTSLT